MEDLSELLNMARDVGKRRIAIVAAEDEDVVESAYLSVREGIASVVLLGNQDKIWSISKERNFNLEGMEILGTSDSISAAQMAVKMVRSGEVDLLMKGLIKTADLLKVVLDKEIGLRTGKLLSHIFLVEVPRKRRWYALTDAAIVVSPGIPEKVQIIENAIDLMHYLGIKEPKVALLAAIETVNPAMPTTVEAAAITLMGLRGQIKGAIIDGPLALDVAIDERCAKIKGVRSPVAGNADVLIVPNVEAGNMMGKALIQAGGGRAAGVVMGALKPIVMTSRAQNVESRLLSIALGVFLVGRMN
ncbi:MAG: bifunctional enoyl-CoA hydratase/phosphate acetyltransferase [Synergistetes bacterium]|nr:bifunctional enoyl-CoA hydratase/phosphate acetyltransferase [Synergistota bacterium]MDW8191781.1 bifunctional enoyl-CoA hydratase/phosphate acetyltransferase [Synergistota bacterium]